MSEATRPLRLVPPPPEGDGRAVRTFDCLGLDALRRALAGVAASGGPAFVFNRLDVTNETWLDTDGERILRAGFVLRVVEGVPEPIARLTPVATIGTPSADADGFAQPLSSDALVDALGVAGPVSDRVRALAGKHPLSRRVEVVTRRHTFAGEAGSSTLVVQLDELLGAARLTLAGPEAAVDAMTALLQAPCELAPATRLVARPAEPDLGPEAIGAGIQVGALAFACLRRHARSFLRNEPGTRLGDDPEALHDMRVAGRRMRAGLALFEAYTPRRGASLRRELGRLGRILGAVRDLDVQLDQVAHWRSEADPAGAPAFDAIEAVLVGKRRAARRKLLAALDSARYERCVARLCGFLRHGPGRTPAIGRNLATATAPESVGGRYRAVRKAGERLTPGSTAPEFHALRIRAKRLRYALEFHQPLYDGAASAMIESLTALQDLLGEHQDAYVAIAHLEGLAASSRRALPPRALFLMGSIAARYAQRAERLRRDFPKAFRAIRGRRWKALKGALAKGAPPPSG